MEELQKLISLHTDTRKSLEKIRKEIHHKLGDVIIDFFKTKGIDYIKHLSSYPDDFYDVFPTNPDPSPDIYITRPIIVISITRKYVYFFWQAINETQIKGCEWHWEKETFETFYNKKLKNIYKTK